MKKLICAKDVESAVQKGESFMLIDGNTLITPSARDAAAVAGIEFREEAPQAPVCETPAPAAEPTPAAAQTASAPAPTCQAATASAPKSEQDIIYRALQILLEKGMLGQIANLTGVEVPYVSESDNAGMIKLVRSNTAKFEPLDTGHAGDQVYFNELIGAADGVQVNAGFMTIDHCNFPWTVDCQEIYYVIDGTLTVEKDGRVFTANPGDCLLFKPGARLVFGTPDKVKVFYVTH